MGWDGMGWDVVACDSPSYLVSIERGGKTGGEEAHYHKRS